MSALAAIAAIALFSSQSAVLAAGGDTCGVATPIAIGASDIGTTVGFAPETLTPSPDPICGTSDGTGGAVWYSVTGDGTMLTASTCNPGTDFDTKLRVWTGSCAALVCVGGNDDTVGAPPECALGTLNRFSTVTWCSQSGVEYYILVHGFTTAEGNYELSVSSDFVVCEGTGACCEPSVGCQLVTNGQAECDTIGAGGTYQGDTTDCATVVCPGDGACCNPQFGCIAVTGGQAECSSLGNGLGTYQGDGTDCATTVCPGNGACCVFGVGCADVLDGQAECDTVGSGGVYQGDGTSCATTVCPGPCVCGTVINLFPYVEDFEAQTTCGTSCGNACVLAPGGWQNLMDEPIQTRDWTVDAGGTPSSNTGPSVDNTTGTATGKYAYTEASSPCDLGDAYYLLSPCLDISSLTSPVFSFAYHMFGGNPGTLSVEVSTDLCQNYVQLFSISGVNANVWTPQLVDLSSVAGATQLRIRIVGVTGAGFESDMAIDDLVVRDSGVGACCFGGGSCSDVGEGSCISSGGAYQGDGTDCGTTTCVEACCYTDGTPCAEISPSACSTSGGTAQGLGSECATTICPGSGACCLPDLSCVDVFNGQTECDGLPGGPGLYYGDGSSCGSVTCGEIPISLNGPITTCSGIFTDSGGTAADYVTFEDYTLTFFPSNPGDKLAFTFNVFATESCCDELTIHDGNSTGAPIIGDAAFGGDGDGTFEGTELVGDTIISSAVDGSLTFVWHSDLSINGAGWAADINCLTPGLEACCNPTATDPLLACSDMLAGDCSGLGGIPLGLGTSCANDGGQCYGACCFDTPDPVNACEDRVENDCLSNSGTFLGAGTNCATDGAGCLGACCDYPGGCVVTTNDDCFTQTFGPTIGLGTTCLGCPPANDLCADAILLAVPSSTLGSTSAAMPETTGVTCGTTDGTAGAVWYRVIGTGTSITATTCSPLSDFDTKIRVWCSDCAALTCVGGDDDDPACTVPSTLRSTFTWCSRPGVEYLILVHGFSGNAGNFELILSEDGVPCVATDACGAVCDTCPGDLDGNGLVNGLDIQAFTNCYLSEFGMAPSAVCGCADINGDNVLDDTDVTLFVDALLNGPGVCDPGRCCYDDGGAGPACVVTNADGCTLLSGDFELGLDCTTACPVPAPNDDCDGAISIGDGTTIVDLTLATSSGLQACNDFPTPPVDDISNDLFYSYVASCTGTLFVDTCDIAGETDDTRLAIYDVGCSAILSGTGPIECNDDHGNATEADTGNTCPNYIFSASLSVPVISGNTYIIRVGSFTGSPTTMSFPLNVSCQ